MFYFLSSLVLNLSHSADFLFSAFLEKFRRSSFAGVVCLLLISMGVWPAGYAHAAQVSLQWDASTDPSVSGYKVYFGKASGTYGSPIVVGNTTNCTISSLEDGATYYFAATAVDASAGESGYSNEAVYTTPGGCTPSLSPASLSLDASGGSGSVTLATGAGCSWTAVSNAPWILLTSNSSGTGGASIQYSVSANSTTAPRTGSLNIAGQTFTVTQSGAGCTYAISPASASAASGGSVGSISVTAGAGCSWNASSGASWISITSGASGSGNGACGYSIAANTGSSSRTGSLTIAGQTFQVTQQGIIQYTLTVAKSGSAGGTITASPLSTAYGSGTVVTLSATPDSNAVFSGWSGACSGVSPSCSVAMTSNLSVNGAFNLKTFRISASASSGGSLSPQGQVSVNFGASQNFTITPAEGYKIADVKVDGASVGAVTSYLFGNVMAGHSITASFAALAPAPEPASFILALNAGGPEYTDSAGNYYQADGYYTDGTTAISAEPVAGTRDPVLYQSGRYGAFAYSIPLSRGDYDVTLHFAETTFSSKKQRIFSVYLEGNRMITDLDTYLAAGENVALDFTFKTTVSDGFLDINFVPSTGEAQVSGILIQKASTSPPVNPNGKIKKYYSLQQR